MHSLTVSHNSASALRQPYSGKALLRAYADHLVVWGICATLSLIGLFTPNGLITSASFLVVPLIITLLWRIGEPPVLLFGCLFQWLQSSAAIFYTNQFGQTLDQAFGSPTLSLATWLSLIAVVVLAVGIRVGFIAAGPSRTADLEAEASRLDLAKIGVFYVFCVVLSAITTYLAGYATSIAQPLYAVASLKWAAVFLLCFTALHQRRGYALMFGCIALEFAMGLFGIFANFKSVFFVLVVAATTSPLALSGRRLAANLVCFVLLFVMGVVWSSIKMDYREFLANEDTANEETIPIERKFGKLADLAESLTWENFTDGIDALVMRVSYVNYFALALQNVPTSIPYENGELWKGSIIHVLTPRVLFPDKPALDDSERTRLYTGMNVAGMESGTSIGIGYIGESYVDFGPVWMFVPIFLLGILYGLIYRFFVLRSRYALLGAAFGVSVLIFTAYEIETSNIKLVGGVVAGALVAGVIYKLLGRTIASFLRAPSSPLRPMRARPNALTQQA